MKYVIRIDELSDKITLLEEKIKSIMEEIQTLEKIKDEMIWEGLSKDAFMIKYNAYTNNLRKVTKHLVLLIAFLKSYYSNYNEEYERLSTKFNILMDNEVIL